MAIKSLNGNVPPSCERLDFSSKTSALATRHYEEDDFEEMSKGRFLVGTDQDVLDVDEVWKCPYILTIFVEFFLLFS